MWKCHKCGKPVYFAERKQSLGYDWHPECLRCEECGKRLNPGQHAEHKGVPYCHVPCYGALFGPQLFGHGTRVESHKSFGQKGVPKPSSNGPALPRAHLESKLKAFNQYVDGRSGEIRSREVNGRLVLEGALRIHWGVKGVIHLKENDDQRTVVTIRKRNSCRYSVGKSGMVSSNDSINGDSQSPPPVNNTSSSSVDTGICIDRMEKVNVGVPTPSRCSEDSGNQSSGSVSITPTPPHSPAIAPQKASSTLPPKLDYKHMDWDELDQLLQVERRVDDTEKMYQTMPACLPSQSSVDDSESISISHSGSHSEICNTLSQSSTTSPQDQKSELCMELPLDGIANDATLKPPAPDKYSPHEQLHYAEFDNSCDESTLRPNSDVDIKKLLDRNDLMPLDQEAMSRSLNEDTLKANSPIDPKKINDSLKLYSDIMVRSMNSNECRDNTDNFSLNCENKLEELFAENAYFNDDYPRGTLRRVKNYEEKISKEKDSAKKPDQLSKNDASAYNRAISMDNSWIGSLDDSTSSANDSNYELSRSISGPEQFNRETNEDSASDNESINYAHPVDDHIIIPAQGSVVVRRVHHSRLGSTAIKRRTGKRRQRAAALRRRCSINGHFYNRETSFFTPPYGSQMSVWVTSLVSTQEVINLMLDKYKVDSNAQRFALFVVRDNGEQRCLKDDEYPLLVRVQLGPHEDISRLFLMDADKTGEVSSEVAQFINLSVYECESILHMYGKEEQRETLRIKHRFAELRQRIKQRMEDLKGGFPGDSSHMYASKSTPRSSF